MKGNNYEVDANCVEEVLIEWVLGVAQQQATLAHTAVSYKQHFEEVVAKGRERLGTRTRAKQQANLLFLVGAHHRLSDSEVKLIVIN